MYWQCKNCLNRKGGAVVKKVKLILLLMLCLAFTGCRQYGEKRIVKLVTVDRDYISLYYYDYSQEKPSYLKAEKANSGIENTLVELLNESRYDLKLCKYAICDGETVRYGMQSLYTALMDARFSPDIIVAEGDTTQDAEKYIDSDQKKYPLYSCKAAEGITAVVENYDLGIKNMVVNSQLYTTLGTEQSVVFDMLTANIKSGSYSFKSNDSSFSAVLEGISVFYSVENGKLNINICASLKSYKGMAADKQSKAEFVDLLQKSIEKNALQLINDKTLAESFDLLWYGKVKPFDSVAINVKII